MDKLWLEHYCHPDCQPLKNIMCLPEQEAFALAKRMADAHPDTTAFGRFADFANYYPRRLKTDALLFRQFCALGGKPQTEHPLSFVLGSSPYLHQWFGEGRVIRLPVDSVPPEIISFTLGDSMSTLDKRGSLTLLTWPMLQEEMARHPEGAMGWLRDMQAEYHYIEVQVWGMYPCQRRKHEEGSAAPVGPVLQGQSSLPFCAVGRPFDAGRIEGGL